MGRDIFFLIVLSLVFRESSNAFVPPDGRSSHRILHDIPLRNSKEKDSNFDQTSNAPELKPNVNFEEKLKFLEKEVALLKEDYNVASTISATDNTAPLSTTTRNQQLPKIGSTSLTTLTSLLLGTYLGSLVLSDLLAHFEWVQSWRYAWPFGTGLLYIAFPHLFLFGPRQQMTAAFLGLSLMLGGAADALLPVYVTGPNVLTAAGMGPDAALGLFFLTLYQMATARSNNGDDESRGSSTRTEIPQEESTFPNLPLLPANDLLLVPAGETSNNDIQSTISSRTFLLQVLLLAELYKLGEGSFYELFFAKILEG